MIESFSFGKMVVAGKIYTSDLIIYPDGRIQDSWWRKSGHAMSLADIDVLMAAPLKTLVVGTGVYGYMKPDPSVSRTLKERGIRLVAEPTGEAWQTYNAMIDKGRVGACFHVGC